MQIIRLLLEDGRMSYTDVGKATGLSTSAAHQRVRRLEQRGNIKSYLQDHQFMLHKDDFVKHFGGEAAPDP